MAYVPVTDKGQRMFVHSVEAGCELLSASRSEVTGLSKQDGLEGQVRMRGGTSSPSNGFLAKGEPVTHERGSRVVLPGLRGKCRVTLSSSRRPEQVSSVWLVLSKMCRWIKPFPSLAAQMI